MKNIILQNNISESVIKKSKFIAKIFPVFSEEEARKYCEEIRKEYYDAKHVCYAYIIGKNADIVKYSDDGEPQGTAGRPMLELLQVKSLTNVLITVTRYFGGILLGASGLVHAYKGTANDCINKCEIFQIQEGKFISFTIPYDLIGGIKKYQESCNKIFLQKEDYSEYIKLTYIVDVNFLQNFNDFLTDFSKGKITVNNEGEVSYIIKNDKAIILKAV